MIRPISLAILLIVVAACSAPQRPASVSVATGTAMTLKAEHLADGKAFDLSELRGKVCLVDVWASWCGPCRVALPFFAELHGRLGPRGLAVVALSVDEERAAAKRFVDDMKLPFTVLWDRDQRNVARLNVPKMPTSFLVDKSGRVKEIYAGFDDADRKQIEADVLALLAEASATVAP